MRGGETFNRKVYIADSFRRSVRYSKSNFYAFSPSGFDFMRANQHNTQTNYIKNYEFDYPQTRSFFVVTCVSGHITSHDFYDTHRKWNSCEPFELFDAPVEVQIAPDKKPIEQNLMTQARRSDLLMIWTDCDREGEHIGMEIVKVCRKAKPGIQVKRARFSAIIAQYV